MTRQEFIQFIKERPALNSRQLSQETEEIWGKDEKVSQRLIYDILKEKRSLTQRTINKILPIMEKYGYKAKN